MSQVTAEQIQSLVERIDHLERQLIDIRKFLQEKFTEGEDVSHKRKISSFQEEEKDGDVEEKKKSKTELVETSLFGTCDYQLFQTLLRGVLQFPLIPLHDQHFFFC
jgi:uncharacterized protein YjcR